MKKFKYGKKYRKTSVIYFSLLTSLLACLFCSFTVYAGGSPIASINGAACNFNTITDAIAAAESNDTINIQAGIHAQIIGEISIDLTLVASRGGLTGCELASDLVFTTIDGMGQTFDTTGGLVKITNGARVTFRNVSLRNASAINGGVMAVVDGSSVTLDNSDIYDGSAVSAGGNVYVFSDTATPESSLIINNGSAIYNGTVISGDGGGLALYRTKLLINEGFIGLMGINQGNSASNNGGGIYAENSSLIINNLDSQIQNSVAGSSGGGIYAVDSSIDINDATVKENTTQDNGGGIYLDNTNLTLRGAIVSDNLTTEFVTNFGGGGLYLTGSSQATIDSSIILSNTSETLGGGILSTDSSNFISIINGSDILNNDARFGGGIFTISQLTVDNSRILFNTASIRGGGIECRSCQSLSIINLSQISHNTALASGGGINIFSNNGTFVELNTSSFIGNTLTFWPASFGGGVAQEGGTILIDSSVISNNSGALNGGGVSLFDLDPVAENVRIINTNFINNSVIIYPGSISGGGALYLNEIQNAQVTNSEFISNESGLHGGAIFIREGSLTLDSSTISENSANIDGGGIYAQDSDITIRNSSITQNEAVDVAIITPGNLGGGGIKSLNSNLTLINSKVNQNISNDIGGGIFYEGSIDNSLTIRSVYGILSDECLPSSLGFNEYCSEVSNNEAIFGVGLMIRGSTNEQGINLSGVALNANNTINVGLFTVSGVAIELDITNPLDTEVTMENLILVENDGLSDINKSVIFIGGPVVLNLFSTTIANNTVAPIRSGFDNSAIVVQNSIIQQNDRGPLIGDSIPFIGLCNNSQLPEAGQSIGSNLGDPQFISTSRGDYRLSDTSPSLDSCTFGLLFDIEGNVRPNDNSNYDQGAFEMNANFIVDEIFMNGFE